MAGPDTQKVRIMWGHHVHRYNTGWESLFKAQHGPLERGVKSVRMRAAIWPLCPSPGQAERRSSRPRRS